ncbi:MAG TPA: PEP-CTERM sorting domain-containing protein [Vicinamibacterales bacterium]|nr:PEP-CTERM sorting domain-containing protein [Vicinamibacterales bacterium]
MPKRIVGSALLSLSMVCAFQSRAEAGSIFFNSLGNPGDVQLILNGGITLNASATGWYRESGTSNEPGGANYITGLCSNCGAGGLFRDLFIFNVPVGIAVTSASVRINTYIYDSLNPTETLSLFDVSTNLGSLLAGTGGVAAYTDLGTGVVYGSRVYTAADQNLFETFALNAAAVGAIQNSLGSSFAMGGSLDSAAVPEPSTFALVFGALGLLRARRVAGRRQS